MITAPTVTVQDASAARCSGCSRPLTDAVTGALDRLAWETRAAQALAAARPSGRPLALVLADLDRFKSVNDRYGHLAGDAVLRATADVLHQIDGAVVGRYGGCTGDEFLLLLPGASIPQALAVARRIQRRVRALSVAARTSRSETVTLTGQTLCLGISACLPGEAASESLEGLLLDADTALREAKRGGGDRIRVAGAALPEAVVPGAAAAAGTSAGAVVLPRPADEPADTVRHRDGGQIRVPLAACGVETGGGPAELVMSTGEAERLRAMLGRLLDRGHSAPTPPQTRVPAPKPSPGQAVAPAPAPERG